MQDITYNPYKCPYCRRDTSADIDRHSSHVESCDKNPFSPVNVHNLEATLLRIDAKPDKNKFLIN